MCHRYDVAIMPGCFTPTEILTAWQAGADVIKVFPATALGPAFFKDVRAPLPQVRLMPTGGVTMDERRRMDQGRGRGHRRGLRAGRYQGDRRRQLRADRRQREITSSSRCAPRAPDRFPRQSNHEEDRYVR